MIEEQDLPDQWELKTLQETADVILGNSPPGESYNENGDGPPFIQGATVFGEISPETERYTSEPSKLCKEGDTIIAIRATIGDLNKADKEYCLGRGAAAVRAKDGMSQGFLHQYLNAVNRINYWREVSTGATFNSITKTNIQELKIPVPPLDEQERIVEAVEERLERVERLEKSVENIGRLADEYEKSLLSFLSVGRDVTEKCSVGGIPEKKNLPAGWDVVQLSEVTNVNPRVSYDESEDYAYVPMDAVGADKKAITRYERRESLYSGLAKFCEGDIIVARITPCFENGKMAVASNLPDGYGFAVGSTEFVVIRPTEIDPEYLFSYLKSPIVRQWGKHRLLGATGRERIKVSQFRSELTVPVPPQETQSQIAKNIKKNEFSKIRTSVNTVQDMFREYESSVLAHATKGNIEI